MSSRRPLVIAQCVIGLAGLVAYAWYANQPGSRSAVPPQAGGGVGQNAPVPVEVALVAARTMADDVTAVGSLVSNESVVLRPEVAGRISRIAFRDGEAV